MLQNTSQEPLPCETFSQCHFLWHFVLCVTIAGSGNLPSFNSSGCIRRVSNSGNVNISAVSCLFYNSTYVQLWNFTFSITIFHFFAEISSMLGNFLSWLSIFVKHHMSLLLGDKEATQQLHTCPCELNNRPAVNSTNRRKEGLWLVSEPNTHLLGTQGSVNWRASSKACTLYNYSELTGHNNPGWNCAVLGLVLFN